MTLRTCTPWMPAFSFLLVHSIQRLPLLQTLCEWVIILCPCTEMIRIIVLLLLIFCVRLAFGEDQRTRNQGIGRQYREQPKDTETNDGDPIACLEQLILISFNSAGERYRNCRVIMRSL